MKSFGHKRPLRNAQGEAIGFTDCPPCAVTVEQCGHGFGADSKRRLVVSLEAGDLVCVRPQRTKRVYRITAKDLFFYLLRCEANLLTLQKARDIKASRAAKREAEARRRAEKRLTKPLSHG